MEDFDEQDRADVLDISARRTEFLIAGKIAEAGRATGPAPTGFCLDPDCGAQFLDDDTIKHCREHGFPADAKRWCDVGCRDGWERHRKAAEREGRRI